MIALSPMKKPSQALVEQSRFHTDAIAQPPTAASAKQKLALGYADTGVPVFPCRKDGKSPLTSRGFNDATTDHGQVESWWHSNPEANIAIPTGQPSKLFVIDVDNKDGKDGSGSLKELEDRHGRLPETLTVETPSSGLHYYFNWKNGLKNSTGKLGPGIDTRGEGGYVLAAGSSIDGRKYEVVKDAAVVELPGWVEQLLNPPRQNRYAGVPRGCTENHADSAKVASALEHLAPDCGYDEWFRIGMALKSWNEEQGLELWNEWSSKGSKYKEGECESKWGTFKEDGGITIASLFDMALKNGWKTWKDPQTDDPVSAAKAGTPWPMTDAGNAERFAYYKKDSLVFDIRKDCWLHYNGTKWVEDTGEVIYNSAIEIVRSIRFEEARLCPRAEERKDLGKQLFVHSISSESRNRLESMISLARHMPGMNRSEFDSDKYLFNCRNGTIELKTGKLREHRREDYITRSSPVVYDPAADCSAWNNFLSEMLQGDKDMMRFIQKDVGYCLSGDTSEEILNLVHGPEATGKSTFMESVKSVLGDYSRTCDFETFLKQKDSGRPRNDLAGLDGARLVSSCEVEDGKELAENVIKSMTGGDTISARFLFKEFFEYEPQFKLWLVCNHAPKVDAQDGAMWRRILRIPFISTIPKEKRDKNLKRTLKNPAIGGVQILKWAVEGYLLWQSEGLQIPAVVEKSTEEYRNSCDFLSDFFNEVCDVSDPSAWMTSVQLFGAYKAFCMTNDIRHTMNMITFSRRLEARGLKRQKRCGVRGWAGICPASKMDTLDGLDTSSAKSPCKTPYTRGCETSVQSVQSVHGPQNDRGYDSVIPGDGVSKIFQTEGSASLLKNVFQIQK